jgi:hypothetical protein
MLDAVVQLASAQPAIVQIAGHVARPTGAGRRFDCIDPDTQCRVEFVLDGGKQRSIGLPDLTRATSPVADEPGPAAAPPAVEPPVANGSKAWLVTYRDGARDLLVTMGDPVEEAASFLAPADIAQIRMIQRVLGGMLHAKWGCDAAQDLDGRWVSRAGKVSTTRPALNGSAPESEGGGFLLLRQPATRAPGGVWQIEWANGATWVHVSSETTAGAQLAARLYRQFASSRDFALRRLDRGRLPLRDDVVPARWTTTVELRG